MVLAMPRPTTRQGSKHLFARKVVPKDVRGIIGRAEFKKQLTGKTTAEKKQEHAKAIAEWEAQIAAARAGLYVRSEKHIAGEPAGLVPPAPSPPRKVEGSAIGANREPLLAAALLDAWARERTPAPNTLRKYRIAFAHVARLLGFDDVRRITEEDVIRFKEARLEEGRTVQTVADDVLACSAVCAWGVKNKRLSVNPFRGLAPRPKERGEPSRSPYTDDEAAAILNAARKETGWRRWLPWLLAFTGARISEIAEMRRGDVREDSGVAILDIVPVSGRAGKNKTFQRKLPIHPALLAEGFLDYVAALPADPNQPLFPDLAVAKDGSRSTTAKNNHGRWVRNAPKVTREGTAPAHSWRHRMEDELRKVRALPELTDAITGRHHQRNAGAGYGRGYRNMPDETLKDLQKIPSPLAGLAISSPVGLSRNHLSAAAAVRAWFEAELDRASQAVTAAEKLSDARERQEQLALLSREAATRIDQLLAERADRDGNSGDLLASIVAKTMKVQPKPGSAEFRALRAAVMQAEGVVVEATMRWAAGDDSYRPEYPAATA